MESQRYALEIDVEEPFEAAPADFILFFHRVIQEGSLPEICVDVADYSHVPDGPGVMLICHEAHYSIARVAGRLRLRCALKRGATGDAASRIRRVAERLFRAARLLERSDLFAGKLRFATSSARLAIEDRLLAPNTSRTFESLAPTLAAVVNRVWGDRPLLSRTGGPKEPFQVQINLPAAPPLDQILARLSA